MKVVTSRNVGYTGVEGDTIVFLAVIGAVTVMTSITALSIYGLSKLADR